MPFAIVGSEEEIEVNGEPIRARRYPWGIVEVDNPQHSDFGRLRNALLSTHLTDLKEITVCRNCIRQYRFSRLTFLVSCSPALLLSFRVFVPFMTSLFARIANDSTVRHFATLSAMYA